VPLGGALPRDAVERVCIRNLLANREERIFFKDRESRFLLVSEAWLVAEGRGRSLEDVIGKTDFEIFSEEHAAAAFEDERRVMETGEPLLGKLERETFDDRPDAWVSTTKLPLRDEHGRVIGTWGIAHDVTAQVEGDESIRRHAEGQEEIADVGRLALKGVPLEDLFDAAAGAAWRVLSSDCAWLVEHEPESSGFVIRAEVGWLIEHDGDPIAREECSLVEYAAHAAGPVVVEDWESEERFSPSPERRARGVRSSVAVLVGDPASPFGLLEAQYTEPHAVPPDCLAFLDSLANVLSEAIRSRRSLEMIRRQGDSLAEMTRSLGSLVEEKERLIEQIPGVVVLADSHPDGSRCFQYVSRRSTAILGIEPPAFIDDPECFFEHLHAEDRHLFLTAIRERAVSARDPLPAEVRFIRPDGEHVWLRVETSLVHANDAVHRVQAVLFDITAAKRAELERDQLELELRLAQKLEAVGQLAAGVAHEINTPIQFVGDSVRFLKGAVDELLTLMSVYRDLLHSEEAIDRAERQDRAVAAEEESDLDYLTERVPPAFERALDGVDRVASIVRAMRQFAHPATDRAPIDVNDGIRTTLTVATNEYKYVADVELDLGELPLVTANAGDLNQVFLNLIVNAAHAIESTVKDTDRRGTITVRTRVDGASVIITVSDTGCGIPAEVADRVFDPFFTTKPVGRGTGQGLAIAHAIVVDRHHGAISFAPAPGGGTTFEIVLPLEDRAAELERLDPAA